MRNLYKYLIVLLFAAAQLFAGTNGGYAGAFLQLGLGARSMALGNAGVADVPDGYSAFYNPASMAFLQKKSVPLSYSFMSLDRRYNFIGFSMPAPPHAGFSVGWLNAGTDNIRSYNLIGEDTGGIEHSINMAYFNFGRTFSSRFAFGVSIKYMWESLRFSSDEYFSSGWGWDFGLYYLLNDKITLGASVRDVSSKLKANTDKLFEFGGTTVDKFPVRYSVGVRAQAFVPWLHVLYDAELSDKSVFVNHIGVETRYKDLLELRFGVNGSNPTFGAGLGFDFFKYRGQLDYAFIPSVYDEGSSHVFSWQVYF